MPDNQIPSTSINLIQQAIALDGEAWERLCRIYTPLVMEWALKAHLQHEDAADVVQEVFVAVSRGLDKFQSQDGKQKFRGWLWGITRHKIIDHFRKLQSRPMGEGGSTFNQLIQQLPDEIEDDSSSEDEHRGIVLRALALIKSQFAENTWKAFWKTTMEDRSAADVSEELGISQGAVYTAKSRVLSLLRRELEGLENIPWLFSVQSEPDRT